MAEQKSVSSAIGGAPISWVALMGALIGGGSVIPLIYYVEGGGYHSLSYALICVIAAILGPWGAGAAAFIGGVISMFLAPGFQPQQILIYYMGPTIIAGLILNRKWKWVVWVPALGILWYLFVPWYIPGDPRIGNIPQPFMAASGWYNYAALPLMLTVGRNLVPNWVAGSDKKKMFVGLMLLSWISTQSCHLWGWAISILFYYPIPAMVVAVLMAVTVPFERLMLQILSGLIGVPLLLSMRRSGLRKIPGAVW